jgi:hypothetical protein
MFKREISDEEIKFNNERILSSISLVNRPEINVEPNVKKTEEIKKDKLNTREIALLWDVFLRPYVPTTKRYETIDIQGKNISPAVGTREVTKLMRHRLMTKHKINVTGERGGTAKFLDLTKEAYNILGVEPKKGISIGAGFEHCFWAHKLSNDLGTKSYIKTVAVEAMLNNNKSVDILVETDNERIAVEIEMTPVNACSNIEKDLNNDATFVFTACRDRDVLKQVKEALNSFTNQIRKKVHLCLVQKLVPEFDRIMTSREEKK